MAPHPHQHHHEADNQFLGKELKYFSQAGFDLDRIHIKVSFTVVVVVVVVVADCIPTGGQDMPPCDGLL
jgi:hypothetical protein